MICDGICVICGQPAMDCDGVMESVLICVIRGLLR